MAGGHIYEAMPKIADAIGAIGKTKKNQQQGYSFRGIDDVYNAAHRALIEHSVFVTTKVVDLKREERATKSGGVLIYTTLLLEVSFVASDGSSVTTITAGEGMDSSDKSTNKAMSAALKYAFFQTFTIPIVEAVDADHETPEPAARQAQKLPEAISPERAAFNAWAAPLVSSGKLGSEIVKTTIAAHRGNYVEARKALEHFLTPDTPEKTPFDEDDQQV